MLVGTACPTRLLIEIAQCPAIVMRSMLVVFGGFWLLLFAASWITAYHVHRHARRPIPGLFIGMGILVGLMTALTMSVVEGNLWLRLAIAGLGVSMAIAMIVTNRRLGRLVPAVLKREPADDPTKVIERFRSSGYTVTADVDYEGQHFAFVASRVSVQFAIIPAFIEDIFIMGRFDGMDMTVLEKFWRICFDFAQHNRRPWWKFPLVKGTRYYPIAMVSDVDQALTASVEASKPLRRGRGLGLELPIIWNIKTGQLYFSRKTAVARYDYPIVEWDLQRQVAVDMLTSTME
jgi:hypothetical protein